MYTQLHHVYTHRYLLCTGHYTNIVKVQAYTLLNNGIVLQCTITADLIVVTSTIHTANVHAHACGLHVHACQTLPLKTA